MEGMFQNCSWFNTDLNNWNVSSVTNMKEMFTGCKHLIKKPSWYKE
jgi:surface protein